MRRLQSVCVLGTAIAVLALPGTADAGRRRNTHESAGHLQFTSPQANPLALAPGGGLLLVANTTSNTVDA
ncbi:MAG: hypothetical protein L0206_15565, partial [Actinobacteria bacterium]|nr:hypothetical protein [Actinomycetota bacterium]